MYICESCFARLSFDARVICIVCNKDSMNRMTHSVCRNRYTIDGVFCGVVYNTVVRKLLYAFKYQPYVSSLGEIISDLLYEGLIQQEIFMATQSRTHPIFIPVPLAKNRYRKRGYNHAKILADNLAKKFTGKAFDYLERIKETKAQYGLKREERIKNIKGAFKIKKQFVNTVPKSVFLVDDVLTSGSTLAEAAKVLKQGGVEHVWGVTFAREQNKS